MSEEEATLALNPSLSSEYRVDIKLADEGDEKDLDAIHTMEWCKIYKRNIPLTILFYILCPLTFFILPIFLTRWFTDLYLKLTHLPCQKAEEATAVLIKSSLAGIKTVCYIREERIDNKSVKIFTYRQANFMLDVEDGYFKRVRFDISKPFSEIHKLYSAGLGENTRKNRKILFGSNALDVPVKNVISLLFDEILHPFYIFQVFSVFVWLIDDYYVYAAAIAIISTVSAIISLIETRRNLVKLRNMARHTCEVTRISHSLEYKESSDDLVPGDLIELKDNFTLPCDVILLRGQCIVNEASLTGTHIIQTKLFGSDQVIGVVCRTGFATSKGQMVLSILYPKPNQFKFYADSFKFIAVMFFLAMVGFVVAAIQMIRLQVSAFDIVKRALDIITITVPPALPVAMTIGTSYAISRLKTKRIFCISPPRVNVAGKVELMCFDKTGTLTEEGLDLYTVRPCSNSLFAEDISYKTCPEELARLVRGNNQQKHFVYALASCHSLTFVGNELVGDPLEIKIFEGTEWHLHEPSHLTRDASFPHVSPPSRIYGGWNVELEIFRQFEFMSAIQRMSVLAKEKYTDDEYAFVKGSPEVIRKLCIPESIPSNFSSVLKDYAHNGFRVIAYGYKKMDRNMLVESKKIQRDEVECNLEFLGFAVLQNKLKHDTKRIINVLNKASVINVMVTGDNPLTAISVSRECGLVKRDKRIFLAELNKEDKLIEWCDVDSDAVLDPYTLIPKDPMVSQDKYELAVTGDVFEHLLESYGENGLLDRILLSCSIFARMTPDQKMHLVEEYQRLDYIVGMCGDGANDCGALKAAHIGVSLSSAEASVAAPFTSLVPSISCIPSVLKEGKCALTTSFQMFKYMAAYSFIQSITVIILYFINSNLGDYQFLFVDLGVIFPTILFMGLTKANQKLVKQRPQGSLISIYVFASLFGQFLICMGFFILVWFDVRSQPFYRNLSLKPSAKENILTYETTCLFFMSSFQTFSIAIAYNISKPFKRPLYTNALYLLSIVLLFAFLTYMVLYPDYYTQTFLQVIYLPQDYRIRIYAYCIAHLVICWLFERVIIVGPGRILLHFLRFKKKKKKQHQKLIM